MPVPRMKPIYDEHDLFPLPARRAATVSFRSITAGMCVQPCSARAFLSSAPMWLPTTSGAFTSFEKLLRMPSWSFVISMA